MNRPFVPKDFPYVRLLAGEGTFGVRATALPWIAEQVVTGKRSAASAAGEILARVPPEGILSKEAYSGKGLRIEFSGVAQPGIGIEAVRVDAVPTSALAECDAASVAKIKSSGMTVSPLKDGGCSFSTSGGDASFLWSGLQIPARDWNVVEFRLAAEGGGSATLVFDAAAGGSHEIPVPLAGDGKLHTYRVILRQFRAEGGRPHGYTPYYWQDAWSDAPEYGADGDAILPETQPHTFTWTVLESARACLYERDGTGTALNPVAQPHPK